MENTQSGAWEKETKERKRETQKEYYLPDPVIHTCIPALTDRHTYMYVCMLDYRKEEADGQLEIHVPYELQRKGFLFIKVKAIDPPHIMYKSITDRHANTNIHTHTHTNPGKLHTNTTQTDKHKNMLV